MIVLLAFAVGMAFGWRRAGKRGGDRLDRWQYAAAYGIAFALVATATVVLVGRLGVA